MKRYEMCQDQNAQIDCRNDNCIYHKNASCVNISPALTINDNHVVCWSKIEKSTFLKKYQIHKNNLNMLSIAKSLDCLSKEGKRSYKKSKKWLKNNEKRCIEIMNQK